VIDGSDAFGQSSDGRVIGDVEALCGDTGIIVGSGEPILVATGHDDLTALGPRQKSDSTRDAAPPSHDENSAALQRITHANAPSAVVALQ
jgi:hypothetical protein